MINILNGGTPGEDEQKKLQAAVEMVRTGIGAESLIMIAHFEGCKMMAAASGQTQGILCTLGNLQQVGMKMGSSLAREALEKIAAGGNKPSPPPSAPAPASSPGNPPA